MKESNKSCFESVSLFAKIVSLASHLAEQFVKKMKWADLMSVDQKEIK